MRKRRPRHGQLPVPTLAFRADAAEQQHRALWVRRAHLLVGELTAVHAHELGRGELQRHSLFYRMASRATTSLRREVGVEQHATTLELFYDLVFVFAITQVSHLLLTI